jgi:hypothetical protein
LRRPRASACRNNGARRFLLNSSLNNGRQVLHFHPVRWERFSQALELTSGELIPCQPPLL